jgi:hypothetical protein
MRLVVTSSIFLLLVCSAVCFAQDPMPVLSASWQRSTQKEPQVETPTSGPARALTNDDKNFQRNVREARTDHPENPSDMTPDGRRAALDKIEQQALTPNAKTIPGFTYSLRVRNDGDKTAKVIYWEYEFAEPAAPANIVRRQFLCSVNLKKGSEIELIAFSTLGPSGVVNAETLGKPDEKRFTETTQVNRIEYSDDSILQRGNWKLADVKAAVQRATATPWGKEMCRPL